MKKYIFMLISLMLLLPMYVHAGERTFTVCKSGCDYNDSTFINLLSDITARSYGDDKIIINIADGDYNFAYANVGGFFTLRNVEMNLGNGHYNFVNCGEMAIVDTAITGKSSDTTFISVDGRVQSGAAELADFTLTSRSEMNFDPNPSDEESTTVSISNVVLKSDDMIEFGVTTLNINDLKTITTTANKGVVLANPYKDNYFKSSIINISDSDFSQSNIFVGTNYDTQSFDNINPTVVNIEGTKLKRVYAMMSHVTIDCDSPFSTTMNHGVGGVGKSRVEYSEFLDSNGFTVYEYRDASVEKLNGVVELETCTDRTIKISTTLPLSEIREDFGYDISDWTLDGDDIVEIEDGVLVPLQIGTAKFSKMIDGEKKTLRVIVVADDDPIPDDDGDEEEDIPSGGGNSDGNKTPDKSINNIVNPKTLSVIVIIISFTTSVVAGTLYLMQGKSMN